MAFEIPIDSVNPNGVGGFDSVTPGWYHCIGVKVDEDGGKKGEMIVDVEILRGTTEGQNGKTHRLQFQKTNQAMAVRKLLALAIASGLTTAEQLQAMKNAGQNPTIDYSQVVGKNFVIHLTLSEYPAGSGKFITTLNYDEINLPNDKRVRHVPLHAMILEKSGIKLPPDRPVDGCLAVSASPKPAATPAVLPATSQAAIDAALNNLF